MEQAGLPGAAFRSPICPLGPNISRAQAHIWVTPGTQCESQVLVTVSPAGPEVVNPGCTTRASQELFQSKDAQTTHQVE